MEDSEQVKLIKQGAKSWNEWQKNNEDKSLNLSNAKLEGADLSGVHLNGAFMNYVDLRGANLNGASLSRTSLMYADLREANLSGAFLDSAKLMGANFEKADMREAHLNNANLQGTNLSGASLMKADMRGIKLIYSKLNGANLWGANLCYGSLVNSEIDSAVLSHYQVFGLSVWGTKGKPQEQLNLFINSPDEQIITVDDLQLAQFIHLLLNNKNVRNILDTISSKAVLIWGRFTPERKSVLDLIREELRKYNYVPILFDFENTKNQSLLETVMTLAGMVRFIIADVTAATMVRKELRSVIEKYQSKSIQPILLKSEKEYVTLPEIRAGFKNLLPTFTYNHTYQVVSHLSEGIILPAENWLKARKVQLLNGGKSEREIELEEKIAALQKQLQEKLS